MQASGATVDFEVRTPIPGLVKAVLVAAGAAVAAGQTLVVLEAMKMENEIRAPHAGVIERVEAQPGQSLAGGALLFVLRPD
jgi:biotin carboxyl carrier protein